MGIAQLGDALKGSGVYHCWWTICGPEFIQALILDLEADRSVAAALCTTVGAIGNLSKTDLRLITAALLKNLRVFRGL